MKNRTFFILKLIVFISLISCDKQESIEKTENIEFVKLTLKKTELTTATIEAITRKSSGYEYGLAINKSDFTNISDLDNCLYFKLENNNSDTVTLEISGLNSSTLYYCKFYHINEGKYIYNDPEIRFNTKELVNIEYDSVYDIEGNVYKTIVIGEQTWMAENLRTTTYNDGNPIKNLITDEQWSNDSIGGYCWLENNIENKNTIGALFNGNAVETGKLCPIGWHLPSRTEWFELINYLGDNGFENYEGEALKAEFGWFENSNGENHYGFSALPAGLRNEIADTWGLETYTGFWCSEKNEYVQHSFWELNTSNIIKESRGNRTVGLSVRCIKD